MKQAHCSLLSYFQSFKLFKLSPFYIMHTYVCKHVKLSFQKCLNVLISELLENACRKAFLFEISFFYSHYQNVMRKESYWRHNSPTQTLMVVRVHITDLWMRRLGTFVCNQSTHQSVVTVSANVKDTSGIKMTSDF